MIIREMQPNEYHELEKFLYEAIFIPENTPPPPREIITRPELQIYIKNFGEQSSDICFVAEIDKKIVGACWARIINNYGHIDNKTPSLALSVLKNFRRRGIATALLKKIFAQLAEKNFKRVSLSVQKENFAAIELYRKLNFEIVEKRGDEYLMVRKLIDYKIREIKPSEYGELENFLYEAIHAPEGGVKISRDVLKIPELRVYTENFGSQPADDCLVVEVDKKIVGACWVRIMNDFSHIDNETPSLVIALYENFCGQGIGSKLIKTMLNRLVDKNFKQVSLSVQKSIPATKKFYERLGFEVVGEVLGETELEYVMVLKLEGKNFA